MNFALLLVGLIAFNSCKKVDASEGTIKTHNVDETGFTGIDLGIGAELTFTESETTSIIIKTTKKVFNALEIEVKKSVLEINKRNGYVIESSDKIEVIITAPNIDNIICSGSGMITAFLTSIEPIAEFNLEVSGSGLINASGIITENFESNISGSGRIEIEDGFSTNSEININGSGNFSGFNLESENAEVIITGSGSVELTVLNYLDTTLNGSGNVTYKGTPSIDLSRSGSGVLIDGN